MERALECAPTRRVDAPMPTVRASRTARNAAMNQMLGTLPDRAMRAAHHVGDGRKGAVPDRAIKWVETGAALAALKSGGRAAVGVVRRNPAIAATAVAGAGLLWLAARHRRKKMEAADTGANDGKTGGNGKARRVRARKATRARKQGG